MANITIERGKLNTVVLTLSERVSIPNPFYLFQFKSKFTVGEERYFLASNTSQNKIRYDEFGITESDTPDNLDGEVSLYTGEWKYTVYQSAVDSLNVEDSTGIVLETGMAIVIDNNYK